MTTGETVPAYDLDHRTCLPNFGLRADYMVTPRKRLELDVILLLCSLLFVLSLLLFTSLLFCNVIAPLLVHVLGALQHATTT